MTNHADSLRPAHSHGASVIELDDADLQRVVVGYLEDCVRTAREIVASRRHAAFIDSQQAYQFGPFHEV